MSLVWQLIGRSKPAYEKDVTMIKCHVYYSVHILIYTTTKNNNTSGVVVV